MLFIDFQYLDFLSLHSYGYEAQKGLLLKNEATRFHFNTCYYITSI